ncbi:hypothetical protein VTN31DRAFT_4046 [Thermomyces dupontii]|uniref:uncharacterized protein n=1 Tax=Talaromyces thermophilus TaxID=28565 RepID=UPI0037448139
MAGPQTIPHAYRHLYRKGLQAIRYAKPQRYVLRDVIRSAFRSSPASDFDPDKVARTLQFLQHAADCTGFEHRIVKNLLMVRYWERPEAQVHRSFMLERLTPEHVYLYKSTNKHIDETVKMLNETLGTCLR